MALFHFLIYSTILKLCFLSPIMAQRSITNVTTCSTTAPKSGIWEGNGGKLFLSSPIESQEIKWPSRPESDTHAFRPPGPTDLRCPCPALNTLANHGYLPRDGKNIILSTFMSALQNSETYNLSHNLAKLLAEGGEIMIGQSKLAKLLPLFKDDIPISLHDLALHGGVEHSASIVHKNVAKGEKYAPIPTDTALLEDFLQNRSDVDLTHIARQRVALEHITPLGLLHGEVARGEWALVLGIFGYANGGKIPVDELRVWLGENRFPQDWHPTHEQTFEETVKTSSEIRTAMHDLKKSQPDGWTAADERLQRMLVSEPDEVIKSQ